MIILDFYFLGLTYIIVYVGDYDCLTWYCSLLPFNAPKTRGCAIRWMADPAHLRCAGLKRIGPHNI